MRVGQFSRSDAFAVLEFTELLAKIMMQSNKLNVWLPQGDCTDSVGVFCRPGAERGGGSSVSFDFMADLLRSADYSLGSDLKAAR